VKRTRRGPEPPDPNHPRRNPGTQSQLQRQGATGPIPLRSQALSLPESERKPSSTKPTGIETEELGPLRAEIKTRAKDLGRAEMERKELLDLMHEPSAGPVTGLGKRR